jgi:hypothetical protein
VYTAAGSKSFEQLGTAATVTVALVIFDFASLDLSNMQCIRPIVRLLYYICCIEKKMYTRANARAHHFSSQTQLTMHDGKENRITNIKHNLSIRIILNNTIWTNK